jgi:aspartyl/glutamyl-tRNA(Asn/Gln) amidotransferase C subunit
VNNNKRKIDHNALELLCKMANITLTQEEKDQLILQLNSIARLFDQISTHTTKKVSFSRRSTVLSEDIPFAFSNVEGILNNVPSKRENSVVCPVMRFQGKKNEES